MREGWNVSFVVSILAALVGCGAGEGPPRSQALVFVDTDMPSPDLADRVRIDVLAQVDGEWVAACDGCSREVAITSVSDWPLSFGVEAPEDGTSRRVRARLFPAGRISAGRVLPETAAQGIVELAFADGVTAQELFLEGRCVGIPPSDDAEASCLGGTLAPIRVAPTRDPDAPSRVGTFRAELSPSCDGDASDDTGVFDGDICIPGGTYWMGDVRRQGFGSHFDAVPEHLVTVTSFYIDRYEYTVGRYRAALARGFLPTGAPPGTPLTSHPTCVYPDDDFDTSRDAFPINCVRPYLAEELCAFDGRRLPTEAEWEWVAGNGAEESLFPWGDLRTAETSVREGPVAVGSHEFDVVSGGVHDLGWNLIEWVADDFQTYFERCWIPGNYDVDPLCVSTADDLAHGRSTRGGYWMGAGDAGGAYRPMVPNRQVHPAGPSNVIGFRCARDG